MEIISFSSVSDGDGDGDSEASALVSVRRSFSVEGRSEVYSIGVTQSPNCASREWRSRSIREEGVMCE